jgi:hypothetical protein
MKITTIPAPISKRLRTGCCIQTLILFGENMSDEPKPVWHEDNEADYVYSAPRSYDSDAASAWAAGYNAAMEKVREYLEAQKQKG